MKLGTGFLRTIFGAALLSLTLTANASSDNPFGLQELGADYQMTIAMSNESKCGEGKCGEGKCGGTKPAEGKCGEGKCGGTKPAEGKCGAGKCGGSK